MMRQMPPLVPARDGNLGMIQQALSELLRRADPVRREHRQTLHAPELRVVLTVWGSDGPDELDDGPWGPAPVSGRAVPPDMMPVLGGIRQTRWL